MICYDVDTALAEVPVNTVPLTDDTDFKTIETAVAYNAGGMALYWHFVTTAGAYTATAVTPTTAGTYDWAHQQQGMYTIEIPASGGASINNDTEGFGYFTGYATGVLPWRGPTICFRAAAINDSLVDAGTTGLLGPTTAGRTLDVSAGGEAGVDWANVGSPTTTLALTGTTIATTQKVDIETIKTNPVVNAGTVTFPTTATLASTTNITAGTVTTATNVTTVNGLAAGVITAASIAADAITDAKVASDVTIASVTGAVGSVTGAVGSVTGAVGSVTGLTNATIADQVWDEILSGHAVSGSTGEALSAAGGAGDPWITTLPGSYTAGQAGYILGTNLNATISSRASSTDMGTVLGYLDTEIAAILADTNELQTDWANGGRLDLILDARSSQASVDDLPTNAELSTALGTADDAVLAAIAALSIPTAVQNADALLGRNVAGGSSTGRTVSEAFYFLRNKWIISGGTLTVYQTDDATSSWTAAITQTAGNPVSASDPA